MRSFLLAIPSTMSVQYESILVGDVGGTNTRLIMYQIRRDDPQLGRPLMSGRKAPGLLLKQEKYLNQEYRSFVEVVTQFLQELHLQKPPLTACFAVAGPVKDNAVTFTNRSDWSLDGSRLEAMLGIAKVTLCNDFLAVGYGLLTLEEDTECEVLLHAPKKPGAPIACIGAGTGLGECFLTPVPLAASPSTGSSGDMPTKLRESSAPAYEYQCYSSEGGHADFSPRDQEQVALVEFLKKKFDQKHRVSVERVVSGTGLANIFEFLCAREPETIDAMVKAEVDKAGDLKGAIIAKYQNSDALCRRTMNIFAAAYGAEAGSAALKWLPFGGLYLTGGLTPKNLSLLSDPKGPFLAALRDKGRVSGLLEEVPVFAVKAEDLGERGAHLVAFKCLQATLSSQRGGDSNMNGSNKISGRRRAAMLKWLASLAVPLSAAWAVTIVSATAIYLLRTRHR